MKEPKYLQINAFFEKNYMSISNFSILDILMEIDEDLQGKGEEELHKAYDGFALALGKFIITSIYQEEVGIDGEEYEQNDRVA